MHVEEEHGSSREASPEFKLIGDLWDLFGGIQKDLGTLLSLLTEESTEVSPESVESIFTGLKAFTKSHSLRIPQEPPEVQSNVVLLLVAEYLLGRGLYSSARALVQELRDAQNKAAEPRATVSSRMQLRYDPWMELLGIKQALKVKRVPEPRESLDSIVHLLEGSICKSRTLPLLDALDSPEELDAGQFPGDTGVLARAYSVISRSTPMDSIVFLRKNFEVAETHVSSLFGRTAMAFSKSSKEFGIFSAISSMIVLRHRKAEVLRRLRSWVHQKLQPPFPPGLELLYYIGKEMESLNETQGPLEAQELLESTVPRSLVFHSVFVCPVLRTECGPDNFPALLTCGHVVSIKAIEKIATLKGSIFKCPYCPLETNIRDVIKLVLS